MVKDDNCQELKPQLEEVKADLVSLINLTLSQANPMAAALKARKLKKKYQ